MFSANAEMNISKFEQPLTTGFLEGYQTFDAIGAVLIGGVIIISLNLKGITFAKDKKKMIKKSGLMTGAGLAIIYTGLIAVGAFYRAEIFVDGSLSNDMQRTNLLRGINTHTLRSLGTAFLSVLVALASFNYYGRSCYGNSRLF